MENESRYALLIDADNISQRYIDIILSESREFGNITIRHIYADWTDTAKSSWKDVLLDNSISPIQQYTYTTGKNSSDSAMIIDAMDILYGGAIDGFILCSSDSDFTRLAMRLRESGKDIVGMGESKTPAAFVRACRVFKTLDVLYQASLPQKKETVKKSRNSQKMVVVEEEVAPITSIHVIRDFIVELVDAKADDDGWLYLGEIGNNLLKEYPDFDCRNYGYKKLIELVRASDKLEVKTERAGGRAKLVYVKLKQ